MQQNSNFDRQPMKTVSLLDPPQLVKNLCLLVLASIPINMLATPIADYLTIESRATNWTVTLSTLVLVLTVMPLLAATIRGLTSRNEKLVFKSAAVFFLYAFSLTFLSASELFYPLYGFASWLATFLVCILFYLSARDKIMSPEVIFWVLASISALAALPLLLVHIDIERFARLAERVGAANILYGYENPRAVGWISTVAVSLLVTWLATQPEKRSIRPLLPLLVTIAATTLFWSGSRGGLVAFAVSIILVFSLSETKNYKGLMSGLLGVALGGAASFFLHLPDITYGIFSRISQNFGQDSLNSISTGRTELWQTTIAYILERPLTGYGFFPHKNLEGFSHGSAHNIILDVWLWFGLIVGTIILLCGIALWLVALSAFRKAQDQYVSALFCVATTLLVYSMLSGPYARTFPLMLFAIAVGTVIGHRPANSDAQMTS